MGDLYEAIRSDSMTGSVGFHVEGNSLASSKKSARLIPHDGKTPPGSSHCLRMRQAVVPALPVS